MGVMAPGQAQTTTSAPAPTTLDTVTVSGILRAGQAWPTVAVSFTKGQVWEYSTAP
jgi:hypothetical protein